eukprot:14714114-Alexandrium_andersonii.AAC.1
MSTLKTTNHGLPSAKGDAYTDGNRSDDEDDEGENEDEDEDQDDDDRAHTNTGGTYCDGEDH